METQATGNEAAISSTVRSFIVENFFFGVDDPNLTADRSFLESGTIDSTGILELVAFLEKEYGIVVQDSEMTPENLDSLERVTRFIARRT